MVSTMLQKSCKIFSPPLSGLALLTKLFMVWIVWLALSISPTNAEENAFNLPLFKSFEDHVYVSVQPNNITLGERVTLTIKGESLQNSFEKIDWSFLQQHLKIEEIDIGFNRIKLRLYPFTHGQFDFPAQQSGRIKLPAFTLNVQPNPEVSIHWKQPDSSLYAQQNTSWKASVWVKNSANKITLEAPKKENSSTDYAIQISPIPVKSTITAEQSNKPNGKTETFIANYRMPIRDTHTRMPLDSPVVVIKNPSNQKWYFFDRPITATLQPLPHFLPAIVTVGQLRANPSPLSILQEQGTLNSWTWQLTGQGMQAPQLKQLGNQLIEQIPYDPAIEWLSHSQQINTQWTEQGIQTTLTLRLPYRITQLGWTDFPALNIAFFNPKTEKLTSFILPSQSRFTLPRWAIWISKALMLLFAFIALFLLFTWLKKHLKRFWLTQQLIQKIQHANHATDLWKALQHWSQDPIHKTHDIQTLGEWKKWYHQTQRHPPPTKLIQQLNQQLYAKTKSSDSKKQWKKLQKEALNWAKNKI
ncbi:MAG: hypothetical protein L3J38_02315 [Thiomicrorhabdus sp.]|nr:hypothetical protein [Thiomicrorhabdus sp.]